jgi:hypothetical protein
VTDGPVADLSSVTKLYRLLRISNDVGAVRRGRVGRRVARRAYGKATGRLVR